MPQSHVTIAIFRSLSNLSIEIELLCLISSSQKCLTKATEEFIKKHIWLEICLLQAPLNPKITSDDSLPPSLSGEQGRAWGVAEPGHTEGLCALSAGTEGLLSSRSTGEEQWQQQGPVVCLWWLSGTVSSTVQPLSPNSLDLTAMQAVCSWLGGPCVRGSHAPHDDPNPHTFQAAQHRLLEHIPWLGLGLFPQGPRGAQCTHELWFLQPVMLVVQSRCSAAHVMCTHAHLGMWSHFAPHETSDGASPCTC